MNTEKMLQNFLWSEGFAVPWSAVWTDPERQRLSALCYAHRGERVLMLQRRKPPFCGYWTAPGGKLEQGETPREAISREFYEETGLALGTIELQLVVSEISPDPLYNWVLFVFRGTDVSGQLSEGQEGALRWILPADLPTLKTAAVDARLLPLVYDRQRRYLVHIMFDNPPDGKILRTEAFV